MKPIGAVSQIALPLELPGGRETIVGGHSLHAVFAALQANTAWPYRTAVLSGPARSGKSLMARWFDSSEAGVAIDDADCMDEVDLFHRWNRAQGDGQALLLTAQHGWQIALPDLASRLGAALQLVIGPPDDALLRDLLGEHARRRGLALGEPVLDWLVPRIERSHAATEALVATLDRLSLERKVPVTQALAREVLGGEGGGHWQPRLL